MKYEFHKDNAALTVLARVREGSKRPEDIMIAIRVFTSCASSGNCTVSDKHEEQINELWNRLAGG
jgi:hypothetical protein